MKRPIRNYLPLYISLLFVFMAHDSHGANITGKLQFSDEWHSEIYLSHIAALSEANRMSQEMIIASALIDKAGYFDIDISFLPEGKYLFRLHIVKVEDSPYSLMLGGKNHNHCFIIADKNSEIHIENTKSDILFTPLTVDGSEETEMLQYIAQLKTYDTYQLPGQVESKFSLWQQNVDEQLLCIADTSSSVLVALYAMNNVSSKVNARVLTKAQKRLHHKWSSTDSSYWTEDVNYQESKLPKAFWWFIVMAVAIMGGTLTVWYIKKYKRANKKLLTIQERKVLALLKEGATNQQIADSLCIGINTVKSHVSSIYAKLDVKSRKELL